MLQLTKARAAGLFSSLENTVHASQRFFFTLLNKPTKPTRMVTYNGIQYNNVVEDLKSKSDLMFAFASKTFPAYKNRKQRSAQEVKSDTLSSNRVCDVIRKKVDSKIFSQANAEREANRILDTMAHQFDLKTVRAMASPIKRIIQRLYPSGIFVNEQAIGQLKSMCVQNPVLFVPSHRTYMDFIILQFLCYHYELPLPAIASAQDFLKMRFVAEMLRRCGAYFIRRSFSDDEFYKAIFSKYVQNLVVNGDSTFEAFVEGTRSRTGKSLHPKYGFLSTMIEPFLTGHVYDITIVPVNITFSRLLEETLYAYELLGFSKPAESTSALFKARSILGTDYGPMYVTFGEPLSLRDFINSFPIHIDRSVHTLPPNDHFTMTAGEQKAVRCLVHKIIKRQEKLAVVDAWPLMCLEIGRHLAYTPNLQNEKEPHIDLLQLIQNVKLLANLAARLGNIEKVLCDDSISSEVEKQIDLHNNLLEYHEQQSMVTVKKLPGSMPEHSDGLSIVVRKYLDLAVPRLTLANYANQCLHLFVPFCYLASNFSCETLAGRRFSLANLKHNFLFLQKLLGREFVYDIMEEEANFETTLNVAINSGVFSISEENSTKYVTLERPYDILLLKHMIEPFLINYYFCIDFFSRRKHQISEREFFCAIQEGALSRLIVNNETFDNTAGHHESTKDSSQRVVPTWFQVLSIDTAKNCLHTLVDLGAVVKVTSTSLENGPQQKSIPFFSVSSGNQKLVDVKRVLDDLLNSNFYEILAEPDVSPAKPEEVKREAKKIQLRAKL